MLYVFYELIIKFEWMYLEWGWGRGGKENDIL